MIPANDRVQIAKAKGRPMLSWVGKRPLREVRAFPSQLVERFTPDAPDDVAADIDWSDWPERFDRGGLLFHGDNKDVLAHLLASGFRGKVDLVYIDPPFDSGADYVRRVQLRGASGSARIDGETYTLGEQIQYTDIWANDTYLQFMYERLQLIKELSGPRASVWLHVDYRRGAQLRLVMDEVFGRERFLNEIVWQRTFSRAASRTANNIHDTLLVFSAGGTSTWNDDVRMSLPSDYADTRFTMAEPETGRRFQGIVLTAPGLSRGDTGQPWRGFDPTAQGRHWFTTRGALDQLDVEGLIYWPQPGGWPRLKRFADELDGVALQSLWTDIAPVNSQATDRTGFPTEKPEPLLARIVRATSNPGDIVLDCFIGSGTTAAVAQKLGRRWIGADINKGAIQTTAKRLIGIIGEQITLSDEQLTLGDNVERAPKPAHTSFTVRRVNDYDLQIQHNEARELAVEHLGVQRTRADTFFHGTLGRELVDIVAFDHPATQLDLQAVVNEIERRPGEERDVVVVALGRELSTIAWLESYNRHRAVNKIRVIDLRTDERHGRFFEHMPASARITFERVEGLLRVRVDDVLSPSIMERLAGQEGVLAPQIQDWRWVVDSVAIDTAYDGVVFDVDLVDIPERRTDLVDGTYELEAPDSDRPAAVRITDMLGEEVLVVEVRPT